MDTKPLAPHEPARYRLQLQGRLSAAWVDWMSDVRVTYEGEGKFAATVVTGTVRDQAGLFGLLSHVRDLGAPLIAVEWIR
ncbi:MAG: hypothetical protein DPW21_15960 [Anaerolineae bacterium]|jgi:hypothetical protein|nr:hypothetical protein [Anaerolineales bacterium]MCQ3948167.1 hypothetical protein [Anaerolineae bacterium]GER80097.1 conserved hypothetical protein [Candidatus Denitrolinea symbiosum]MCK6568594.1 hypothetical protein [Anaerolineales bacterium]MCZ2289674.1 hypothetical protein [Anaerolineales bacterium]